MRYSFDFVIEILFVVHIIYIKWRIMNVNSWLGYKIRGKTEEDRINTRSIQESIGNVVDCQIGRNVNVLQDMFHFFVKVVGDNSVDDRGLANLC